MIDISGYLNNFSSNFAWLYSFLQSLHDSNVTSAQAKKKKKVAKTRTRASKTRYVWNWNIKIQTTVTLNARTKVIYFFFRVLLHFSSRFSCFSCSNHIQISFHSIFWIHRLDVFFIFITKNTSANRVLFLQFCKCL